jgi:hypothetical protein
MRRAGGVARLLLHRVRRLRRFLPGRARWFTAPLAVSALAVPALGILAMTSTAQNAAALAARMADAAPTLSRHAPRAPATAQSARRSLAAPAVGALFRVSSGRLGTHFCTASVVDSPHGDLVITAAHCVSGKRPGQIAFVPGYHDGVAPYGVWFTRRVIVDASWRRFRDIDHDVAFLVVERQGSTAGVQALTGGERLEAGWSSRVAVHVVGYPGLSGVPVLCASRTQPFGLRQMRFDCGGYTAGTSGGPFLARWDPATGRGAVIGVIGGYEQGGDLASVSYSPRFGRAIRSLYLTAVGRS